MAKNKHARSAWIAGVVAIWLILLAFYLTLSMNMALKRATSELNEAGFQLLRTMSQRVAQHEAHMTTLASLILASDNKQNQLLAQVGDSIMRYYPRIKAIQEVEITWRDGDASTDMRPLLSTPADISLPGDQALGGKIFVQKAGEGKAYANVTGQATYLLTKKLTESNPAPALLMQINPQQLLDLDELPDWASLQLLLDGATIMQQNSMHQPSEWLASPQFSRIIDSRSQPFLLTMQRPIALADLFDAVSFIVVAMTSLIVLLLLGYNLQHRREMRQLKQAGEQAQRRNDLLQREAQLAHAARVNSLGELASGIAHELAQPLTALMSQSRAAERMLDQAGIDNALLKKAMAANVREAGRAGDMLKRMRDYISNRPPKAVSIAINEVMQETVELMSTDLGQRHIELHLQLGQNLPQLLADPVELAQVINNLIRNAADSLQDDATHQPKIVIHTRQLGDIIEIRVSDNGPGIAPEILPRLFEPFFTTKANGMGLGLALCATLVERIGGRIEAQNEHSGGAGFIVRLPVQPAGATK